jgi:hypothetical protein
MALKNMSMEEMLMISQAWVSPENPAREAIGGVPRLAGVLPDLEGAHAAMYAVTPKAQDPRKAEIARTAVEVDALHDRFARGIHGYLTEAAALDDSGAELLALRDTLMPDGLAKVVQATYRGQAGYGRLLRERLTPALRAQLEALPLRRGNLLGPVESWLSAADRLGELEEERARLDTAQTPSTAQQVIDARNRWVRVVNAFESLAALADLDATTERLVFGPLRDAEAKADQRIARRKASAPTPPAVAALED